MGKVATSVNRKKTRHATEDKVSVSDELKPFTCVGRSIQKLA